MSISYAKTAVFVPLIGVLVACGTRPIISKVSYDGAQRQHLYDLNSWRFQGRLALRDPRDSWSATIRWSHQDQMDRIKLSGPLGQGSVAIVSVGNHITVDRGNGYLESSGQPEQMVKRELGISVPLQALRYWVLGLPEEDSDYQQIQDGFVQAGWSVSVQQFMQVDAELMPRKLVLIHQQTKLKLVIDQWVLNDSAAE